MRFNTFMVIVLTWVLTILMAIYGTYDNTVKNAELVSYESGVYEIRYNNTGDIMLYEEGR